MIDTGILSMRTIYLLSVIICKLCNSQMLDGGTLCKAVAHCVQTVCHAVEMFIIFVGTMRKTTDVFITGCSIDLFNIWIFLFITT